MEKIKLTNEKLAFEQEHKGFKIKAFWGDESEAWIEITKDGQPYSSFTYPAYRVFNLSAHFSEMVENELQKTS